MLAETSVKSYIKLSLGRTRLLLPGEELLAMEPVQKVRASTRQTGTAGVISVNGKEHSVFAPDENLECTTTAVNNQQVCVCLAAGAVSLCLLCDDAALIHLYDVKLHALPACMYSGLDVILNIAVSNDTLYCLSDTVCLARLVDNPCPGPEATPAP